MLVVNNFFIVDSIRFYIQFMISVVIYCGFVGFGFKMKYVVNIFFIIVIVGLVEVVNLVLVQGLDFNVFGQVFEVGLMVFVYLKFKVDKIFREDWLVQVIIKDCYNSIQFIMVVVEGVGVEMFLIQLCGLLYKWVIEFGFVEEDMIFVVKCLLKRGDEECCDKKGGF